MNSKKVFEILGEKHLVTFPNVGQIMDIESLKMMLSSGKYGSLVSSNSKTALFALDTIDAISFLSILCPKLRDKLDVKDYTQLDILTAKKIVNKYKEEIHPWYEEIMKQIDDMVSEGQDMNKKSNEKKSD